MSIIEKIRTGSINEFVERCYKENESDGLTRRYLVNGELVRSKAFVKKLKEKFPTELGSLADKSVQGALNHYLTQEHGKTREYIEKGESEFLDNPVMRTITLPEGYGREVTIMTRDPKTRILVGRDVLEDTP